MRIWCAMYPSSLLLASFGERHGLFLVSLGHDKPFGKSRGPNPRIGFGVRLSVKLATGILRIRHALLFVVPWCALLQASVATSRTLSKTK